MKRAPNTWSAREAAEALHRGEISPAEIVAAYRVRIEQRESEVGAWQHLDWECVHSQVARITNIHPDHRGPLWGMPIGIKDIFDTCDMPTSYGSDLYSWFQPAADAACVARLRAAGAVVVGKTVSTEFAYWKAGKTRNPLAPDRTAGGSSSGSAAAVADNMVPLAIGSQTAASTIRPASYCGIVGLKPTRGIVSLAGVKGLANSLDTVGFFARNVDDVALLFGATSFSAFGGAGFGQVKLQRPHALRVWTGPERDAASDAARQAVDHVCDLARDQGIKIDASPLPSGFESLHAAQSDIMAHEAARELAHERRTAFDELSEPLQDLIVYGEQLPADQLAAAREQRETCQVRLSELFSEADILLLPSTVDVAPMQTEGTGDPIMSRAWTLLGFPSITLPCGRNGEGLPLGLQLAARPYKDVDLLRVAAWFEEALRVGIPK